MVNASWDIVILGLIVRGYRTAKLCVIVLTPLQWYFWVETKGKTLEEVDALFEGEKHSSVPDIEQIRTGREQLDSGAVEDQINAEIEAIRLDADAKHQKDE